VHPLHPLHPLQQRGRRRAGTYIEKALTTELSGNLIDICPVGALLDKPYSFVARPWELRKTVSVDVHDALGSNISVDARGSEVLRILPRTNEDVNEEWLGDKSRFAHDGLKRRRLDKPWVRVDGKLRQATWPEAFGAIAAKLRGLPGDRIGAIAGDLCDAESMVALKDLMGLLGSANLDCRQDGAALPSGRRDHYTFNTTVAGIEEADAILLVGSNPRRESPVLNSRIRKRMNMGPCRVGYIGQPADLTYHADHLGVVQPGRVRRRAACGQASDDRRRAGRAASAGRRGGAGGGLGLGGGGRRADAGVARLQRAAHGGGAGRRAGPGLRAGSRRQGHGGDAGRRRRSAVAAGGGRV